MAAAADDDISKSYLLQKVESVLATISSSAFQQAASSFQLDHNSGRVSHSLHQIKDLLSDDNHESQEWMGKSIRGLLCDAENLLDDIHSLWKWKEEHPLINKNDDYSSYSRITSLLPKQLNDITLEFQHLVSEIINPAADARSHSDDGVMVGREWDDIHSQLKYEEKRLRAYLMQVLAKTDAAYKWKLYLLQKVESVLGRIDSSVIQQGASSRDVDVSINLQKFKDTLLSFKDTHTLMEFEFESLSTGKIEQVLDDAENMLDEIHSLSQWESLQRKQKQKLLTKAPPHDTLINKVGHFFSSLLSSSSSSSSSSSRALTTQIKVMTQSFQDFVSDTLYPNSTDFYYLQDDSDDMVIGREIDKEIIIEKLLLVMKQYDQTSLPVVVLPIVGMRGLGKSTLAKFVLHDKRISEFFSVRIWVSISPISNNEKDNFQIIKHSSSFDTTTIYQSTLTTLHNMSMTGLAGEKVLVVLDDVEFLESHELREVKQMVANGINFLLTTHSRSIASKIDTTPSYILQPLSLKDSLSLFEKLATKAEAYKYPELIEVGKNFVNRCGGIPLIIKAIGEMLFRQQSMVEWESMRHNGFRDLPTNYGILTALKLSYDYMPSHLKQCFQLFSLYPNDFVFHSSEVISLWAALDLLPSPIIDETLIDVSYQCLQKIIPSFFKGICPSWYFILFSNT